MPFVNLLRIHSIPFLMSLINILKSMNITRDQPPPGYRAADHNLQHLTTSQCSVWPPRHHATKAKITEQETDLWLILPPHRHIHDKVKSRLSGCARVIICQNGLNQQSCEYLEDFSAWHYPRGVYRKVVNRPWDFYNDSTWSQLSLLIPREKAACLFSVANRWICEICHWWSLACREVWHMVSKQVPSKTEQLLCSWYWLLLREMIISHGASVLHCSLKICSRETTMNKLIMWGFPCVHSRLRTEDSHKDWPVLP